MQQGDLKRATAVVRQLQSAGYHVGGLSDHLIRYGWPLDFEGIVVEEQDGVLVAKVEGEVVASEESSTYTPAGRMVVPGRLVALLTEYAEGRGITASSKPGRPAKPWAVAAEMLLEKALKTKE